MATHTPHTRVGYVQHRNGTLSWTCSCGADGATRFNRYDPAARFKVATDHLFHQLAERQTTAGGAR